MSNTHPTNPLHGVKLEQMLVELVDFYGYSELAKWIPVRCFMFDPSIKSSLKFARKTPWVKEKVQLLYVEMLKEKK